MIDIFQVLKYGDAFVDERLLHTGIYEAAIPTIFSLEETIESIINRFENFHLAAGYDEIDLKNYKKNISCCHLQVIQIKTV